MIGWVVVAVLTVLAYRKSRQAGRTPFFWIPAMWVVSIGATLAFQVALMIVIVLLSPDIQDEKALEERLAAYALIPSTLIAIGSASLMVWAAGRPTRQPPPEPINAE